jgi:hypothetical protein
MTTRLLTSTYANGFDTNGTLKRLKPLRGLTQAATRIACVVAIAIGSLLSSAAYAYAPRQGFEKIVALKAYASMQMNQKQFTCLEKLYTYESHWNPLATNGSHWGIPQGESVWLRNKSGYIQIDWGLRYIKHRYNTPCIALQHFNRYGWH